MTALPGVPVEPREQDDEVQYGFWLYLMSDSVIFGLLFATFAIMAANTAGGPSGASLFSLANLSAETALLLTSTLTMALAWRAAAGDDVRTAIAWLLLTLALGAGFLALELRELTGFALAGAGPSRSGFLSAFFTLVGTHGMHVAAAIVWGLTLTVQLLTRGSRPEIRSRLLRLALFWHFLDIVWIGVFSVVYLPELAR